VKTNLKRCELIYRWKNTQIQYYRFSKADEWTGF